MGNRKKAKDGTPQQLERFVAAVRVGPVYIGKAAVGRVDGMEFVIVGPDAETVSDIWDRVVALEIDPDRIQDVVIASHTRLVREAD